MSRRARTALSRMLLASAIAVTASAGGATAGDAPRGGWLPPIVGFASYESADASVAIAPNGVAVAVWHAYETGLTAATKLPGGSWQVVPLIHESLRHSVALDDDGNALVTAWHQEGPNYDPLSRVVAFTRRAGSGAWSGPVAVSGTETTTDGGPALAMNGHGQAIAVWIGRDGETRVLRAALRSEDGSWSAPETLREANSAPSVAIDGRGDAVVVWASTMTGNTDVYALVRPAGSGWQPAVRLSSRAELWGRVQVTMNRRGDALAVWGERDRSGKLALVSSRRAAGTTSWTPQSQIPVSEPEQPLQALDGISFALDESGTATLLGQTHAGQVEAATENADAPAWRGPVVLGDGGPLASYAPYGSDVVCVEPRIGLDASGGALAIWGGAALYAARRPAGSETWETPVTVAAGPACFGRALAVAPSGDAVAIWNPSKDNVFRLDAAVSDVTPPVLEQLDVPSSTRTRHRVCLSVAASDLWTTLDGPPLWEFGDGARARGLVVRHVYRRPGRYLVSVTVDDLAGNHATSTAGILVKPAAHRVRSPAWTDGAASRPAPSKRSLQPAPQK